MTVNHAAPPPRVSPAPAIPDELRALLQECGYRIAFRVTGWTECLVGRGSERWFGHGLDEDDALANALDKMLPSALARHMMTSHAARRPAAAARERDAEPPEPAQATPPAPDARDEAPLIDPQARGSLALLERLSAQIEGQIGDLARLAPVRQRALMLVWICRARAAEQAHPAVPSIQRAVAQIAQRLGEIATSFWPGSVHALRLSVTPAATGDKRAGKQRPHTWADAEIAARRKLDDERNRALAAGCDEEGWADAALRKPAAPAPDELLDRARTDLERLLGPAAEKPTEPDARQMNEIVAVARTLRWIRGSVRDHVAWCTAMGRLRRLVSTCGEPKARLLRETLDPRHLPPAPWPSLVQGRATQPNVVRAPEPVQA